MFMVFRRKKIVASAAACLLFVSLILGMNNNIDNNADKISSAEVDYSHENDLLPGEAVAVSGESDYFLKAKTDKDIVRSKATELLRSILDDSTSSEESKKQAEDAIIRMAGEMDKEVKIETLLKAKGFNESVVFISDTSTTITVKSDKLSNEDMAKINDIALEITGNNNIKIVEVN